MASVRAVAGNWVTVIRSQGPAAVETVYAAALDGKIAPDRGHVLTMANPTPPGLSNRQKGPMYTSRIGEMLLKASPAQAQ